MYIGELYSYVTTPRYAEVLAASTLAEAEYDIKREEFLSNAWDTTTANSASGDIDNLTNIESAPVYIYGCPADDVVPWMYQQMQRTYYTNYGALIKSWLTDDDCSHTYPATAAQVELQWLYMNLEKFRDHQ